jgi:atypical dual specificity phosphatase
LSNFLQIASYFLFFDTKIMQYGAIASSSNELPRLQSPQAACLPLHRFPSNFSFVPLTASDEDDATKPTPLIGMAIPTTRQQVEALKQYLNVDLICSFIEPRRAPPEAFFDGVVSEHISVPWGDMSVALDESRLNAALSRADEVIASGKSVAFHCYAGMGRTGTALALYLVKFCKVSPQDAIRTIRRVRPGSIETLEQEKLIDSFGK